ncbi:hypothetical protein GCM10023339_24620 [Alloalcanivorax gelatiniphagus]
MTSWRDSTPEHMPETGPLAHRRFEHGWLLAGLAWGVLVGIGTAVVPIILVTLAGGAASEPDSAWLVPLMWLGLFAITGAIHGGLVGLVVGVGVVLFVGRDPDVRAARRRPATLLLLLAPLAVLTLWYL